ncbi:hypothetical protein JXQ70_13015 [bacterium]|nr:hypothetical protein [bacterium]
MDRSQSHSPKTTLVNLMSIFGLIGVIPIIVLAANIVPTDIMMPGTQPIGIDNPPELLLSGNCGCHDGKNADPEHDPLYGWQGAMMGNAGRDPLFWATLAVAEQDFLPNEIVANRGGAGDLCLRCHSVNGWLEGRSTPTNGSGLDPNSDKEGIVCHFCHIICNPDQTNNIPNPPEGIYSEEQNSPFLAYDELSGAGYYGGAEFVLNTGETRMGPYLTSSAKHDVIQSAYHRDGRLCGICHDVSNPATGDLAHNHGSVYPFTGTYSGIVNDSVENKAALNNEPHSYGIVERTFSEWIASSLDTMLVNNFGTLPGDLQEADKALSIVYHRAYDPLSDANYEDGTLRYYTCQTCHMPASVSYGAKQGPLRYDNPQHDQTGGSYWIQQAIQYQDDLGTLRFGIGLSSAQTISMNDALVRSENQLAMAASLSANQVDSDLVVRVTNCTGHKLISGYPEGRRMWLNIKWYDPENILLAENGGYGPLGNIVQDLTGTPFDVQSVLDPSSTKIYEAQPGMTREWAVQLINLGYPATMALEWDRLTNTVIHSLGDLAAEDAGTVYHTFHFVLNNTIFSDNRIPPYGFSYDEAAVRNSLPYPETQYGDPGAGGTYNYWDEVAFTIPSGADHAEISLLYQSTTWEYIQFLWMQNDMLDPYLGAEGINMLDAWLNTGMCPPFEMASMIVTGLVTQAGHPGEAATESHLILTKNTGNIEFSWGSAGPGCMLTDYAIYTGDLFSLSSGYSYQAALSCFITSPTYSIAETDPAVTFSSAQYFLVVSSTDMAEGSYGSDYTGVTERPASTICHDDTLQDLSACL